MILKKNKKKLVTINSRRFDGQIQKSWKAAFLGQKGNLLTFVGKFSEEIEHSHLGIIRRGVVSYEFYWLDRWYNVFRFHEPEGNLRNFYCNLNLPPKFDGAVLDYVDLDIDVLVWRDFRTEALDLEEFNFHSNHFQYTEDMKAKVSESFDELLQMIKKREFPFNFK